MLQLLSQFYQEDFSPDIAGEVKQFQNCIHSKYQGKKTDFTHAELYGITVQEQIRSVFPNRDVALQIFFTFMVTNVSAIVFAAQENQEPTQNDDGSREIGLCIYPA